MNPFWGNRRWFPRASRVGILAVLLCSLVATGWRVEAAAPNTSATWSATGSGNWNDTTKWAGGNYAKGANFTATFGTSITGDATVTLNLNLTIGFLVFDEDSTSAYTLSDNGRTLTLNVTSGNAGITVAAGNLGAHTISAALSANDDLDITNFGSPGLTINSALNSNGHTMNVAGDGDTTFATGVISGNGSVTKSGTGTLTFGAAQTFTGAVTVNGGTLVLNSSGTMLNASSLTISGGTFRLDNSATSVSDRFKNTAAVTLSGGTIDYLPMVTANNSETMGAVTLSSGANTISSSPANGSQTSTLTFGSLTRSAGATLNFTGTSLGQTYNEVAFASAPSLDDSIIGGWATVGNDFATYSGGTVSALSSYVTSDQSTWTTTSNAKPAADEYMDADRNINSLNLASGRNVDVGAGQTLNIESGGLIKQGASTSTIQNGTLTAGGTGSQELVTTIETGGTLTISSVIADNSVSGVVSLTKAGGGTLVLSGNNTLTGPVRINSGTIQMGANDGLADTTGLTINSGTIFDLNGYSDTIGSLAGSGTLSLGAGTLTAGDATSPTFTGVISGSGSLVKAGSGTMTLRGASTLSGTVTVNAGVVVLDDVGSMLNVSSLVLNGGTFRLDNTAASVPDRMSDSVAVTAAGGTLDYKPLLSANNTETLGALTISSGGSTISTTPATSPQTSTLAFSSLSRSAGATINFTGTSLGTSQNKVEMSSAPTLDDSIIGGWATVGNDFATYSGGSVLALTTYDTGAQTGWTSTDNAKPGSDVTLTASRTINSLNLTSGRDVDITAGRILTVDSGGIIKQGATVSKITNGTLRANSGVAEIITHVDSARTLVIGSVIADNGAASGVTKAGAGTLQLFGNNTFTGPVRINGGTLQSGAAGAIPDATAITINAGGAWDVNGITETIGSLSGAGTLTLGSVNLTVGDATSTAFSGDITGSGKLFKTGTGTLTLSGANTAFTGDININGGGKLQIQNTRANVESFASATRLGNLTDTNDAIRGGTITMAYTDSTSGTFSNDPTVPSYIKLGFDAVGMASPITTLGLAANDLANYNGLVLEGGTLGLNVNQTFTGYGIASGARPGFDLLGGRMNLYGGGGAVTLEFAGEINLTGGILDGGTGLGAAKGILKTSSNIVVGSGVTILNAPNITMNPNGGTATIDGPGSLDMNNFIKTGAGTVQINTPISAVNLQISQGTLLLGADNLIGDSTKLLMAGGTFATGGYSDTMNTLTLTADSTIDMGSGSTSILNFAANPPAWTGGTVLYITNWQGRVTDNNLGLPDLPERIYFGSAVGDLSTAQLGQIQFVNPYGLPTGTYAAKWGDNGEVIPVPEPSTVIGLTLLFGAVAYRERKFIRRSVTLISSFSSNHLTGQKGDCHRGL